MRYPSRDRDRDRDRDYYDRPQYYDYRNFKPWDETYRYVRKILHKLLESKTLVCNRHSTHKNSLFVFFLLQILCVAHLMHFTTTHQKTPTQSSTPTQKH